MISSETLTTNQIENLAKPLVGIVTRFFEDPNNKEEFEKWLQQKESKGE